LSDAIAWANGLSQLTCTDGAQGPLCATLPSRWNWNVATTQVTAATSNSKVYVEGNLVAVEGDKMAPHPDGLPCTATPVNHEPVTSLCAAKVSIGGKKVVRVGSKFNTGTPFDHTVLTGSGKVFIGGPSVAV
jgi:uncharacterized Zn-binding protein involved in type VI secretion